MCKHEIISVDFLSSELEEIKNIACVKRALSRKGDNRKHCKHCGKTILGNTTNWFCNSDCRISYFKSKKK